jgi:hypothetical protein
MKKITIIYLVLMLALPVLLHSQYGGGNGRGDVMLELLNSPLTNVENNSNTIPTSYSLQQNYPNPFNPTTKIKFDIPSNVKRETSDVLFPLRKGGEGVVTLKIYDILGKEIATLVNEQLAPGTYEVTFDGSEFPSGVYFYQLKTNNFSETKKLLLIK